jgi:hypothetical protein
MKTVQVLGHAFDCLPGHVTIAGKGSGTNVRAATKAAVDNMLSDERLNHKRIGNFKMTVVVQPNGT